MNSFEVFRQNSDSCIKVLRKIPLIGFISSSIKRKFIAIIILVLFIPLIMLAYFSYRAYSINLLDIYTSDNKAMLDQVTKRTDDYFLQLDRISLLLYTNLIFSSDFKWNQEEFRYYSQTIENLTNIFLQRKETESSFYYTSAEKNLYYVTRKTSGSVTMDASFEKDNEWLSDTLNCDKKTFLIPNSRMQGFPEDLQTNPGKNYISVVRRVDASGWPAGVLCTNYRTDAVADICRTLITNINEGILFTDSKGRRIYEKKPDILDFDFILKKVEGETTQNGVFNLESGYESVLVLYSKSVYNGNIVIKAIPTKYILSKTMENRNWFLLATILILTVLLVLVINLLYRITRPIVALEKYMGKVGQGKFDNYLKVINNDETGRIVNAYNNMITQVDQLINEKYRMKLSTRIAQIKALQAQINPHFIHNTLQLIGGLALEHGLDDINAISRAISNMMRYSIKSGGDLVNLNEELTNIRDYIFIQKMRFEDRMELSIDVPESMYKIRIPRLTLQPIVENAITHGIESKKSGGCVIVKGTENGNYAVISVCDNGVGISESYLKMFKTAMNREESDLLEETDHIGLINVFYRFRLLFGEDFKMEITSEQNKGTQVSLYIPL